MTATLRRYCLCGATATASSTPPELAAGIIRAWDELHVGEGHGEATPRQAAAARRRARSEAGCTTN